MSKNAKRILMLVGGGILALLIVLALFGNTYARYTSVGEGDAAVSVALWDVESVPVTISGTSLSPSKEPYVSKRESRSGFIKVFDVVNNSDVDAALYFNVEGDADGVRFSWKDGFKWGEGMDDLASNDYGGKLMAHFGSEEYFKAVVYGYEVFQIQLGMEVDPSLNKNYGNQDPVVGDDETYVVPAYSTRYEGTYEGEEHWVSSVFRGDNEVAANGGKNAVYANVHWRSLYEGEGGEGFYSPSDFGFGTDDTEDDWAEFSDAVDTILCMYADSISFVVNLNTVQASTLPKT